MMVMLVAGGINSLITKVYALCFSSLHTVCVRPCASACVGSYPDRLIHGTHPSYWVRYRSGRLWAAADRSLGTREQLSQTDTQWLQHAGIPGPPGLKQDVG